MRALNRTSLPDQGAAHDVGIVPWLCLLTVAFAVLWSHANLDTKEALAVVFVGALLSSIAGFAFSPLAGSVLFHVAPDPIEVVKILLVASIAQQLYCVWRLRGLIKSFEFIPYLVASLATLPLGVFLLLHVHTTVYLPILGCMLMAFGMYAAARPNVRAGGNPMIGRVAVGALGGLTGGLAAFPGAFITIWCQAQGFSKERQRSIVQPFILINQLVTLAALSAFNPVGSLSADLLLYAAPAILGAYFGLRLFEKLSTANFNRVVGAFLFLAGAATVAHSL
jgi:uncharacterized membrane protein YfcA